jgi:hypothetical protein
MRRIVTVTSAALVAVPLALGTAGVAGSAAPTSATGGSPEIGGDEGPLGVAVDREGKGKRQKKKERHEGSSVAGIGPGDNPIEEGHDSVPDTNGLSTEDTPIGDEDSPLGDDGPLNGKDDGPIN